MKYEILPHTGELRLKVFGKTIEELFENAAFAMADILAKRGRGKEEIEKKEKIQVKSADINSLLVDFLSEILAKSQINKCVYLVSEIKIDALRFTLNALCSTYSIERFDEDIKAITYEDLDIKQINPPSGGWQTIIVFDV